MTAPEPALLPTGLKTAGCKDKETAAGTTKSILGETILSGG